MNASPEPFLAMRAALSGFLQGQRPSVATYTQFDEDLHILIAQTSGSNLLVSLVKSLKLKTRIFDKGSIPERFEPGCHEHIEIIDAILARNSDRAEAAMQRHIENARSAILSHLYRFFDALGAAGTRAGHSAQNSVYRMDGIEIQGCSAWTGFPRADPAGADPRHHVSLLQEFGSGCGVL